jgi:adenylylsulfate kinase
MSNLYTPKFLISKENRLTLKNQKAFLIWFTGLSGSGKTSLASSVEQYLFNKNHHTYILDGDNIRKGLNKDLGFSNIDRNENIRRVSEVCTLFLDAGLITLASFITPFETDRQILRNQFKDSYVEVYLRTPYAVCAKRDSKGIYSKVQGGSIKNFTGKDSKYEKPENPNIIIDTSNEEICVSTKKIIDYLEQNKYI